jgi:hypothetical protein
LKSIQKAIGVQPAQDEDRLVRQPARLWDIPAGQGVNRRVEESPANVALIIDASGDRQRFFQ